MSTATLEAPTTVEPAADLGGGDSFATALEQAFASFGAAGTEAPVLRELPEPTVEVEEIVAPVEPVEPVAPVEGEVVEDPATPTEEDFLSADLDPEQGWTPKAAHRFQQLKAELKQTRSELEELRQDRVVKESKLQELSGLADAKNYEELEAKVRTYEQKQMLTDLESTQVYKDAVAEPINRLVEGARDIAEKYGVDSDALLDALAMDDETAQEEALSDLLAGASDRDKARVYRIVEDLTPIFAKRAELYANVAEALSEAKLVEEERTNLQAAERARERTNVTGVVAKRIAEKVPFITTFAGVDLAKLSEAASAVDPAAISPVDGAYNALSGKLFPVFVREYASLQKELDNLTTRLAAYERAEPGAEVSTGTPHVVGDEEVSFSEALRRSIGG
jgi:hypothetical protein